MFKISATHFNMRWRSSIKSHGFSNELYGYPLALLRHSFRPRLEYSCAKGKKVKVWTLAIWVRLVTSSALQSRKLQLIGMSQWCRSALCGHLLHALTDNWTHGAASRHIIAPISHTKPSPRSRSYYLFPVPLRVGGWVGLTLVLGQVITTQDTIRYDTIVGI